MKKSEIAGVRGNRWDWKLRYRLHGMRRRMNVLTAPRPNSAANPLIQQAPSDLERNCYKRTKYNMPEVNITNSPRRRRRSKKWGNKWKDARVAFCNRRLCQWYGRPLQYHLPLRRESTIQRALPVYTGMWMKIQRETILLAATAWATMCAMRSSSIWFFVSTE